MLKKSKGIILIQRIIFWTLYFFSGFILYSNKEFLPSFLITFSRIYNNALIKENITVNKDAITGNKLNHNCEVVIFESIGRKLVLFLILICNQNIDNG